MIFLAVRYLLARRRQTILTLLGIFFGTAAYIAISGFMLGFRGYFVNQLVNNNAHVHIQPREDFLTDHSLDLEFFGKSFDHAFWDPAPSGRKDSAIVEDPQAWYRRLAADPRVLAFSPQLTAAVIFSNGKATAPATIIGCDPLQQMKVTTIADYIVEGSFTDLAAGGNRVVLGDELRKRLGVRLLQNVMVASATNVPIPFKVVGIFRTGSRFADQGAYGALADIQAVNRTPNQVNEIAVRLEDYLQSAPIASTWSSLGQEKVESWDQLNANIFEVFRLQDAIRYVSIGAILVVAAFGIYNVLNMTVMQKRKDIAILRSLGYQSRDIIVLFFSQGVILGFSGALLGAIFGYLFSRYMQTIPFAGGPMGGRGPGGTLIISYDPKIYIQAVSLALLSAIFASLLPARAAGKLTPIEIIRAGAE